MISIFYYRTGCLDKTS